MMALLSVLILSGCLSPSSIPSTHLPKKVIERIYPSIVEVVVPKLEDKNIVYERPLPFDHQDFHIRRDSYHPLGTAFFIAKNRLASAAHVFGFHDFTLWKNFHVRDSKGKLHKVGNVIKYSQYRDFIEFELETYPKRIRPLKISSRVEIGDIVYAVGNAQGEGISTRGGQVSSFTPEHVQGLWKFIRFSSPASPGNSGGPLVNAKGEVVGVVVMKNSSENLNFALPIQELEKISSKEADFFERTLRIEDGTQVVTGNWRFTAPLPSPPKRLRELAVPSKNLFYQNLIKKFQKIYGQKNFPYHPRFRDYLRKQRSPLYSGRVSKDSRFTQWNVTVDSFEKIMIAQNQALYHSKGGVFSHAILMESPDGHPLKKQFERQGPS